MKKIIFLILILGIFSLLYPQTEIPISDDTEACIECHESVSPGIVNDWKNSRHSKISLTQAFTKKKLERRISITEMPDSDSNKFSVGCFECHGLNPDSHDDNFEHFGYKINVIVSPNDCASCHPEEVGQYIQSKKGFAYHNLADNPVYSALVSTIISLKNYEHGGVHYLDPTQNSNNETCYACHGTKVEVAGMKTIDSEMGEIEVPELTNYPNMGVGRINPDGSRGSCAACHSRHSFSIEVARKPYTCRQCHLEPDVPAYKIYKESKHGNLFDSKNQDFNWTNVPWKIGEDFTAPTCAVCHNAEVVSPDGEIIAERTHDFSGRLWVRIFGLIYSHPQPDTGNTSVIENADGLPLPTTFLNERAEKFLINDSAQTIRKEKMKSVCASCHSTSWTLAHFDKIDKTNSETDEMVKTATLLLDDAWENGIADKENPFDEAIEQAWIKQWLFYANSVRHGTAMMGPDYTSFKLGWWEMTENLMKMEELKEIKSEKQ